MGTLLLAGALYIGATASAAPPQRKVFVLGVDGLDPKLVQAYVERGLMPNVGRLIEQGAFKPLGTSMPPLSPVAWSTLITGMDPGGHGVFDFIHRDPATLLPTRAETEVREGKTYSLGGCRVLPVGGGPENLRQGRAFWQVLEEHGVPTVVFRMPANFPPVPSSGKSLSGMGTPDIQGTPGMFSFYTDRTVPNAHDIAGGEVFPIRVVEHHVQARLKGPPDPFRDAKREECRVNGEARHLEVDFDVWLDPGEPLAKLDVQGTEFVLREGEWSDWVKVEFKALPVFASVSALGRFYLKQVRPQFELYVTPLQIDPANPGAMPLSTPADWSHELCEELGYFYTQELPQGTKALTAGVLNGREFWQHSQFVFDDERRALDHLLRSFDRGLLFFYISTIDQDSHMLWNYMDPEHPGHLEDELLARGIESLYRDLDKLVGQALTVVGPDTTFVILSDHGFAPFYWQVNLNSWLVERGYAALLDPTDRKINYFLNVDWSRTRAYAVGLNGLYVNLRGRERGGIVNPGAEHEKLLADLERDLLEMVDPRNDKKPVSLVVNTRRDFHGPLAGSGPDIIVGYSWGYRSSWKSPLGMFPYEIFLDNEEPWSGDHSMDHRLVPGVLISNRPITLERPALQDVTVSILDEYGVPKLPEMIGSDCLGSR